MESQTACTPISVCKSNIKKSENLHFFYFYVFIGVQIEAKSNLKWEKTFFFEKIFKKICSIQNFVLPLHPQSRNRFAVMAG